MLDNTDLLLRIFAPTLDDAIARTATVSIDDRRIEFDNARFLDLSGDPYFVVAAQLDVTGATLSYRVIDRPGRFLDVDDDTGFNGYAMTFLGLRNDPSRSIHSVEVIAGSNTLDIPLANLSYDRDTIFVNVDGLPYATGAGVAARIGFRVAGTGRDDLRRGAEGNDLLLGKRGDDRLTGAAGDDLLRGGQGDDALLGGAGNDRLEGAAGRDRLDSGSGRDLLTGGAAADVFVFSGRFGADTIRDFDPGQRGERIDLSGVRAIDGFGDLRADHLVQRGDDAVILAGRGNAIRLEDVDIADLSAGDFLF